MSALSGKPVCFSQLWFACDFLGPLKEKNTHSFLCCLKNVDLCRSVRNWLKHCVSEQETFSLWSVPLICLMDESVSREIDFSLLPIIGKAASVIGGPEPFISFHVYHLYTGPHSGTWTSASHFVNQRSKFLTLFWMSLYVCLKIGQRIWIACWADSVGSLVWNLPGLPCCW